ncbi:MAG TPA: hypothetical protein VN849_07050, partial [Stellaceae bacterium]|nr:hypothetical protein [Stellaceae bacterium]
MPTKASCCLSVANVNGSVDNVNNRAGGSTRIGGATTRPNAACSVDIAVRSHQSAALCADERAYLAEMRLAHAFDDEGAPGRIGEPEGQYFLV